MTLPSLYFLIKPEKSAFLYIQEENALDYYEFWFRNKTTTKKKTFEALI